MRRVAMIAGTVAFGALLGGCATTVEMGPGYYHYDTRAAGSPPAVVYEKPAVVYREPTVVVHEPTVAVREPTIVYRDPAVVYHEPTVIYRTPEAVSYKDRGQ